MTVIKTLRRSFLVRIALLLTVLAATQKLEAQVANVPAQTAPYAVAVNPETGQAYIANQGSNSVTVINGTSSTTIPVGSQPSAVAVNPLTNKIYIVNRGSNSVTVIDGTNPYNTVNISVGAQPNAIAVNPVTNKIYVTNGGASSLTVINGANNTVSSAAVPVGAIPVAISVNPSTNKIYVANQGDGTVTVINGVDDTVSSAAVPVGNSPAAIVVNPVVDEVYVANQGSNNVTIIDGSTDTVSGSPIAAGTAPSAIAVNAATGLVYVVNTGSNNVTVVNGTSTSQIATGPAPVAVAVNSQSNNIFVANSGNGSGGNSLTVINGADNSTKPLNVGNSPRAVAVNPVDDRVYVANFASNSVSIVNGSGASVSTINTAQNNPTAAVLNTANNTVYVTNPASNTLSVINAGTNQVTATIAVTNPSAIAVNSVTNRIYVLSNGQVIVYDGTNNSVVTTIALSNSFSSGGQIVVNPVTNRIYVIALNSYSGNNTFEINGDTNPPSVDAQFNVSGGLKGLALNPVTNLVYLITQNTTQVTVLNGGAGSTPAILSGTINIGMQAAGIAVNTKTNKIYVGGSQSLAAIIDGATNQVTSVGLGGSVANVSTLLVNELTNQVFVAGSGGSFMSVINASGVPETYTVNPSSVSIGAQGSSPVMSGVIDPLTNTIYFGHNNGSTAVTIVDGNNLASTYDVAVGTNPSSLAVNPATNEVYVANSGSNYVSVIAAGSNFQAISPTATLQGIIDAQTVPNPNIFETTNPTPSFAAIVTAAIGFPNATALYYSVDGNSPLMSATLITQIGGTATFNIVLSSQQVGTHVLYVFPAFGDEGGNSSGSLGTGNSPYLGSPTTVAFVIDPAAVLGTSLQATASPNPQELGSTVTLTATVIPEAINHGVYPTGTVTFTDENGDSLGTTALPSNGSGAVSVTTTSLAAGPHTITATYGGDTLYTGSSGMAGITIAHSPTKIIASLGQAQTIVYGASFANLVATVTDNNDIVIPSAQVTFTASAGSGLSFSPASVTTNADGQAVTTVTQTPMAVGTFTATATLTANGATADFTLTVTPAELTVTADPVTRLYGQPNPVFTPSYSGFVNGDTSSVITGAPVLFSTATPSSPPGMYAISVDVSGLTAANYTFVGVPGTLTIVKATPTITLNINPAAVAYGDLSVLTATVMQGATGTVSFMEGTTLLGAASVDDANMAILPISTLGVGTHTITAIYKGDPNYDTATSAPEQLTVTRRTAENGGPALEIRVDDATRTAAEMNPAFSYSVTGQLVNGDTYSTAISGTPVYATTAGTTPGTFEISLSGLTSANYTITIVPGTLTVVAANTTTTLVASPTSTQYGDPVALMATVDQRTATGTVSFYDGKVFLGQGTVTGGSVALTTSTLNAGVHTITAVYNGDAIYASSNSGPATVTVAKKTGANGRPGLTVTVQNESRTYGTADPEFTYVVSGALVGGDTYETAVTGVPVYTVADAPNSPAGSTFPISISGLVSENYQISAVPGTLTISAASTETSLTTSTTSTEYGNPVTLKATVTPAAATGTVAFTDGSVVLGTGMVSGGTATLTTSSLGAGTYTITATYLGDSNYGNSTSTPVTVAVTEATEGGGGSGEAVLTVTVTNASRPFGQANPGFSYAVTGELLNGDTYAKAVTGVPVYSTPATPNSPPGTYPVSIVGGLSSNNYMLAFVNGILTVTALTADFSATSNTPPQVIPPGASASYNILITSVSSTFNDPVSLTATGLPPGATYTFSPASVIPGVAGATSTLTVVLPQESAAVQRASRIPLVLAVLLLPLAGLRLRRGKWGRLLALVALISVGAIAGCSVGGYFSKPQQTYSITVIGSSGAVVHSTNVTLTVE